MLGSHDKLRRHPVHVGALIFDHTIIAFQGIAIAFDGNDGMRCHAGFNGNIGKNQQGLIIRRHGIQAGRQPALQAGRKPQLPFQAQNGCSPPDRCNRQTDDAADDITHPVRCQKTAAVGR